MASRKQRKGSLTNLEVGIIRNLLTRGKYKNQDILGLINTVRRQKGKADINGGRITDVKTNSLRYKGIIASSDQETDDFVKQANSPIKFNKTDTSPLGNEVLDILFPLKTDKENELAISETDQIECKESFGGQHWIGNCIKAIAAFSNNKGGYIAFGVRNKTWEVIGVKRKKFEEYDRKNLNQVLRTSLSCGIEFDMAILERAGKTIGLLHISPAPTKPVMFIRQVDGAAEGHIYYRYQAENRLIAPAELQQIIEERIRTLSETILSKHISNILSNGIENSAILNTDTGVVDGKAGNFVIDEELLPKISFIKEGEFVEKSGSPTLRLLGDIKKSTKVVETRKVLADDEYPYKPREAAKEIEKLSGRKFTSHNHAQAWKKYEARPANNAKQKNKVNKQFCIYHKAHGDYTYSKAWIDFVVEKISADMEFDALKACKQMHTPQIKAPPKTAPPHRCQR